MASDINYPPGLDNHPDAPYNNDLDLLDEEDEEDFIIGLLEDEDERVDEIDEDL